MIKAVVFDLDGVLVDADKWHFNALNIALQHSDVDPISWQEHLTIYKGIPTAKKLELLSERKGLPRSLWPRIHQSKQEVTVEIISRFCEPDPEKIEMIQLLQRRWRVAVCSNSIRPTLELMLERSGLLPHVDFFLSNQDVTEPKPHPEIYHKAFERLGVRPEETVVVEDSDVGKKAALDAGGILCSVAGPSEVNYYRVLSTILEADRVNVVIPAAGQGKRFAEVGFQHPKPLIDVLGRPMIGWVLGNFRDVGRPIVILQKSAIDRYRADEIVRHCDASAEIIGIDGLTEGAACTVLKARDLINNSNELVIANSDQFVECDIAAFISRMRALDADGGMLTFRDTDVRWSFARTDADGRVLEVAEKKPISDNATVGIYYYRHGSDFVRYAERMIARDIRHNGEFYVCPVYNQFIEDGKWLFIHEIPQEQMKGMGTPEDLRAFLESRLPAGPPALRLGDEAVA